MNIKITRQSYFESGASERVGWLDNFAKDQAEKNPALLTAVETARQRDQKSILDQISYVINNKPAHASVESAVKDMQERTGLNEYMKRLSTTNEETKKTAQEKEDEGQLAEKALEGFTPEMKGKILTFIKNKLQGNPHLNYEAIKEELAKTFRTGKTEDECVSEEELTGADFENLVNALREKAEKNSPAAMEANDQNLGKEMADTKDLTVDDVFKNMTPNSK